MSDQQYWQRPTPSPQGGQPPQQPSPQPPAPQQPSPQQGNGASGGWPGQQPPAWGQPESGQGRPQGGQPWGQQPPGGQPQASHQGWTPGGQAWSGPGAPATGPVPGGSWPPPPPPRRGGGNAALVIIVVVGVLVAALGIFFIVMAPRGGSLPTPTATTRIPSVPRTPPPTDEPTVGPLPTSGAGKVATPFDGQVAPAKVNGWTVLPSASDKDGVVYQAATGSRLQVILASTSSEPDMATARRSLKDATERRQGTVVCGTMSLGVMVQCFIDTPRYGLLEAATLDNSNLEGLAQFSEALADAVA